MTTVSYQHRVKRLELEHGKMQKTVKKGYNVDDPACYPVPLFCTREIDWKISLQSYNSTVGFSIVFNDEEFRSLPYQSEVIATGA